jgi:hypothetical protein
MKTDFFAFEMNFVIVVRYCPSVELGKVSGVNTGVTITGISRKVFEGTTLVEPVIWGCGGFVSSASSIFAWARASEVVLGG